MVPQQGLSGALGLTPEEQQQYRDEGFVIKRGVFPPEECQQLVDHMTAWRAENRPEAVAEGDWNGFGQCHLYDKKIESWMLDPRLRTPLRDAMGGDEPEGIKSFWWFKVQPGFTRQHCDGTALPGCVGVWIPMVDVDGGVEIGTLALQSHSHLGKRVLHDDIQSPGRYRTHTGGKRTESGEHLREVMLEEIFRETEANGGKIVKVAAPAGSAVIFHGHLIHRAVLGSADPSSERFRPVLACHYVPAGFPTWPHVLWERIDFDGVKRWSDGTDVESEAAMVNSRLPPHPGMPFLREPFQPSIFPCRRDDSPTGPLRACSEAQVTQMDALGYCTIPGAFSPAEISNIRAEVDALEQAAGASNHEAKGNNSDPAAITFTQGLVGKSALLRDFCSSKLFRDICWDVLHVETCWLWNEQAVYKKPGSSSSSRIFPYHQDNGYAFIEPMQVLTCWIALSDASAENGAIKLIPKLHRRGPLAHEWDHEHNGLTIPGLRDDDAVCVPLKAGDVALFWSLTPHGSGPNTTTETRKAYIVQFSVDGWDNNIWARGVDARSPGSAGPEVGHPLPRSKLNDVEASSIGPGCQFIVMRDGLPVPPPPMPRL